MTRNAFISALAKHLAPDAIVLETHLSWVILAGHHAFKIRRPVDLGFADFSSLEKRRLAGEVELRLNRRTAPTLYEALVPVTGPRLSPAIGGEGPVIEWAVRMKRFAQSALLDRLATTGRLEPSHIDALALAVARLHEGAARAQAGTAFGTAADVRALADENITGIRDHAGDLVDDTRLRVLRAWTTREGQRLDAHFNRRHAEGFVRECHGDLHLGNIALLDGTPVPFDAIEFSERLRWIDVTSEVAFTAMDLEAHGLAELSRRFVDAYLSATGDYAGLAAMRFYRAYRALVRAKVAAIRYAQCNEDVDACAKAVRDLERHLALAERELRPPRPALVAMHGPSGSGKTTISQALLESLGAVRIRSDVERKRLHGLDALDRSDSPVGGALYDPESDERTRMRLLDASRQALAAGERVIVDSTALRRETRSAYRQVAVDARVPFVIVDCRAPDEVLRERVVLRAIAGRDASEAGLAVLERQRARVEPLEPDERIDTVSVGETTPEEAVAFAVDSVRARLR